MLNLDGTQGEGGGQILRTALGLSLLTGQAFRLRNIRGRRPKPGLMRQHLTAVEAAAALGQATVEGAAVGSRELVFTPGGPVRPGTYRFAVGTAGSATLVLQAVLPALLTAGGPSTITVEGGTHNPAAPPADFLMRAFLPLVARQGPGVELRLERHGFYPAGGGCCTLEVRPAARLAPLVLTERGALQAVRVEAVGAQLPAAILRDEAALTAAALRLPAAAASVREVASAGPGNLVLVTVESANVTEVFTSFGERGRPRQAVAQAAAAAAQAYLDQAAPVGPHLADQLIIPLALAGAGRFVTVAPTPHTLTNIEIVRAFLPDRLCCTAQPGGGWEIAAG